MSWRCWFGLHSWVSLGQTLLLDGYYQCRRCKIGSHVVGCGLGEIRFTPEAMREAWDEGKIFNEAAYFEVYGP